MIFFTCFWKYYFFFLYSSIFECFKFRTYNYTNKISCQNQLKQMEILWLFLFWQLQSLVSRKQTTEQHGRGYLHKRPAAHRVPWWKHFALRKLFSFTPAHHRIRLTDNNIHLWNCCNEWTSVQVTWINFSRLQSFLLCIFFFSPYLFKLGIFMGKTVLWDMYAKTWAIVENRDIETSWNGHGHTQLFCLVAFSYSLQY